MECRNLDVTIISARNLENVRKIFKMQVHARVSISGTMEPEKRTPTDTHGHTNPSWHFKMSYTLRETMLQDYTAMLVIKLYCTRKLRDRYIGEIHTPVRELFDRALATGGRSCILTFPMQKGCVNCPGELELSCCFGEKVVIDKSLLAQSVAVSSVC